MARIQLRGGRQSQSYCANCYGLTPVLRFADPRTIPVQFGLIHAERAAWISVVPRDHAATSSTPSCLTGAS
ncbi:hypothetical protein RvY_18778 [Ramazzottius varieornatus]|uniref:Uncharacterized protein n=1 Tax=Ramazzottius varieornatus TaxID=947166 RepID=A0A1D1W737_RAMVA|nr:hypothetical protein RvY_18778 [Ramazzottius varieornatus]